MSAVAGAPAPLEEERLILTDAGVERGGRWLVRGIDLLIDRPRLHCLLGPNGSGKTTVLRLLCGLWAPSEGEARLGDRPLTELRPRQIARRVAYVPQRARPLFDFTVREVVAMGRYPLEGPLSLGRAPPAEASIDGCLERTDIVHLGERPVTALSGGELQRVLIARCLAAKPRFLLLDEPTANLDLAHALEVMRLCRELVAGGTAVVIALHDLNAARRHGDQIHLCDDGRLVAQGAPQQVLTPARVAEVFHVIARPVRPDDEDLLVFELPDNPAANDNRPQ